VTIHAETATGTTTLRVAGELDVLTAPVLNAALDDVPTDVVLDLRDVSFVDSTGLAVLVSQRRLRRAKGTTLRIERPRPNVVRAFALAGYGTALETLGLVEV
jgi:anti-anti-sigma factor